MSLADARKHWTFLATGLMIFVAVAVIGPLLLYGAGYLIGRFGNAGIAMVGLSFGMLLMGGIGFIAWVTGTPGSPDAGGAPDTGGPDANG